MTMTGELADIDKFITTFERYSGATGYNDVALQEAFKKGLSPGLVSRIANTFPAPANFTEYKKCAVTLQVAYLARKAEETHWGTKSRFVPRTGQTLPTPASSATRNYRTNVGEGMTRRINAIDTPDTSSFSPPLTKLTAEERQRLVNEKKCFKCRQLGHVAKFCPTLLSSSSFTSRAIQPSRNPSVPLSSASIASTSAHSPAPHDSIKDISNMFNKMKGLDGKEKEQAAAYLKDLVVKMDF